MSDETHDPTHDPTPVSGNRWEPTEAEPGVDAGPEPAAAAPSRRPTWLTRTRAAVAGGAAAVLIAGGLGGFAVGRATAGTEGGGRDAQQGGPAGFDRDGDGYGPGGLGGFGDPGGQDGRGGPGVGQDGQVPVMPGTDNGSTDGSSDSSTGTDSSDT